jgi:glucose/arabinose dehydrogenase
VPDIIGPARISFQGRGNMYVTFGWAGEPAARAQLGAAGDLFGLLVKMTPNGAWQPVADVSGFEQTNNPDGVRPPDSNPFAVLAEPGHQYVTDAGGNDLLEITANGGLSLVAKFPAIPITVPPFNQTFGSSQAVPTEVRRGPDGALYVSELTGAPFLPGAAGIYRVVPGQAPQLYAGGFTQITDFDWSPDGNMYVLQIGSAPFFGGTPALIQVAPNGARTTVTTALVSPAALAIAADGTIYVAQRVMTPGQGEVLRIVP